MGDKATITPAQQGLGDMGVDEFRAAALETVDLAAGYLGRLEDYPVLPDVAPGAVRSHLPQDPPAAPEPIGRILDDFHRLIEPNITHWQHPMFLAYFASVAAGPGILGEWLAATLNSNVMLWRNAPASTELEELVVGWLRGMMGLPPDFDGMFTDTASVSSLLSIVAARHAVPGLDARDEGLSGRNGLGRLRLYASAEAHSSIEKGAIVAGIGRAGVRRIPVDAVYRMRPDALEESVEEDRRTGWWPFCVVATLGTTSSTSIDPVADVADVCARQRLWLHVDAAYGGAAALVPEMRQLFGGWERADSIVVNPHKWMFTPFDASLLLFRKPETFKDAFSLVPEYLRTPEAAGVHNFSEYGIQLGRRFRALKMWMTIRYFGTDGMAARIREHCRLARLLLSWIAADPDWEILAPAPFATLCFRFRPRRLRGLEDDPVVGRQLDAANTSILDVLNRSGRVFLSHTRLADRYTLRVSIGNPRTTERHVRRCWDLLREAAGRTALATGEP